MDTFYIERTDTNKTNMYRIVCHSRGTGPFWGEEFVSYQHTETKEILTTTAADFDARMKQHYPDVVY